MFPVLTCSKCSVQSSFLRVGGSCLMRQQRRSMLDRIEQYAILFRHAQKMISYFLPYETLIYIFIHYSLNKRESQVLVKSFEKLLRITVQDKPFRNAVIFLAACISHAMETSFLRCCPMKAALRLRSLCCWLVETYFPNKRGHRNPQLF